MRLPLECFISCTTKCNLKCAHCYSNSGLLGKNIDFDVAANFVNNMRPLRIVVSGGEPFLIIDKLIPFFKKLKYKPYVVIATNGTLVVDDVKFQKIRPYIDKLQISLDSLNGKKYKHIRGVNLLSKVINNIKKYKKKIEIQIAFCIFKSNINEIERICKFCVKEGIKSINVLRPRASGRQLKELWGLTAYDIKKAYQRFIEFEEKEKKLRVIIHDPLVNIIRDKKSSICVAAKEIMAIDVENNLKPCPFFIRGVKGDPIKIWNENYFFKKIRNSKIKECLQCEYEQRCGGGCKANSYNLYNKVLKDPLCFV